ncbi:MAG: hypothetical protein M1423_02165 [Acidobacteria bacterium]|nr:hypothetical protein [Acidobacteriota bacterium]
MNFSRDRRTTEIWRAIAKIGLDVWICMLLQARELVAAKSAANTNDSPLTTAQVVRRMVETNHRRTEALRTYSSVRTYHLELHGMLHLKAEMKVRMNYQWPGKKDFTILSQSGSAFMRKHVLKRLIKAENEASGRTEHQQAAITPRNYNFKLDGIQNCDQDQCYVLKAVPKKKRKFLFNGRIWVNTQNFAIMRIEGQPATTLSWWTTKVNFVYRYKKVGEFWLPALNRTVTHVRIFGRSFLTIKYQDYDLVKVLDINPSAPVKLLSSDHTHDGTLAPPSPASE